MAVLPCNLPAPNRSDGGETPTSAVVDICTAQIYLYQLVPASVVAWRGEAALLLLFLRNRADDGATISMHKYLSVRNTSSCVCCVPG